MKKVVLFLISTCLISGLHAQTYLVTDYGALGDGSTLNTIAIQAAIDDCSANGGGDVVFESGNFVTGTIVLKNNVSLLIQAGVELRGSTSIDDYPDITPQIPTCINTYTKKTLIYAEGQHHIGIRGGGTINGQGASFLGADTRPFGLRLVSCQNVVLENLSMRNSGFWMMNNLDVDTMVIRNVDIVNLTNSNNDGLSLDGCRNVLIENCTVDSNDDPLVIKTTSPALSENIEIRNCTVATWSRAIKIGTETLSGVRNVHIHDIDVVWSSLAFPPFIGVASCGINLAIMDGGFMENVVVEDITIESVETALVIRLGNGGRVWEEGLPPPAVGYLKDVIVRNVTVTQESNTTSSITGIPGFYAKNLQLENVVINFPGGQENLGSGFVVPENETERPENTIFGDVLPAYGLYIRHVDSLQLNNVCFNWQDVDGRPGIIMEDVTNSPNYTVVPNAMGGCVGLASSINDYKDSEVFWIDMDGKLHFPLAQAIGASVSVYNALGQLVWTTAELAAMHDLSELHAGSYIAVLQTDKLHQALRFVR